ncbi:unnamed protein product [Euphydryas editha]|uniref:Arrestin C-terminal-like domain-containing protein n=1 Tax=Euphydryas editha TaxID=104508 RepID=A0AAU9TN74_EUPED|nr:unnamed protein product [Euphydryas editha]
MGFDDGKIVLDSPNRTYYTGQTVRGNLIFDQNKVKTFRGIYVKFVGFCNVHWTTTETRRVGDKDETYTVVHSSYEEYCNVKKYLVGDEDGDNHLQPGHYDYSFSFKIPDNGPSSFEGEYGHVRYEIKVVVDKAFKFDQKKKVWLRVIAPLDLNMYPYCKEPLEMEFNDTYSCCCFSSGSTDTVVNAPLSGYCPGQKISMEITSANKGNVEIEHIKLRIKQTIVFEAIIEPDTRVTKDVVAEIKKGPIPSNTTRNWTVEMEVPDLDGYNLSACSYISVYYKLQVVVSPEACHSDSHQSRPIIIGTIPLVGFQDDVVNPLQDQMPQQVAPITEQPLSSSVTSPYSPNDASKLPYPSANPPNPVNTPGTVTNPPYPVNSPGIITNPPYPVNTPSVGANRPHPNVTPYHDHPPPYPGNSSPYLAQTSSNQMGSLPSLGTGNVLSGRLMKTGNVGFIVQGGSNMSNMPYPGTTTPLLASVNILDCFSSHLGAHSISMSNLYK